jgi:hypothetical protein
VPPAPKEIRVDQEQLGSCKSSYFPLNLLLRRDEGVTNSLKAKIRQNEVGLSGKTSKK